MTIILIASVLDYKVGGVELWTAVMNCTSSYDERHGMPSRDGLSPVLSTTARVSYSTDELLSLRRDELPPPRPVRKVIFRYRLWRPSLQRHQQPVSGNPAKSKHHSGIPR